MANRNRCQYIDQDYFKRLNETDLNWLKCFNNEYYFGDETELNLIPNKKEGYNRRNKERGDVYLKTFTIANMADVDFMVKPMNREDAIIAILDKEEEIVKLLTRIESEKKRK
jgi:hypothetical protein